MSLVFRKLNAITKPFLEHPFWTFLGTVASLVAIWLTVAASSLGQNFSPDTESSTNLQSSLFSNNGLRYFERVEMTVIDGFATGSFSQGNYDTGNQSTYRFRSTSPFNPTGFLIRFEGDQVPYPPPLSPLNAPQSPPYHWRVEGEGSSRELIIPVHARNYVTNEWSNTEFRYALE